MSIRDQIRADVSNVLLALDVFGERITWDGIEITAVRDYVPETWFGSETSGHTGVQHEMTRWIVAEGTFSEVPVVNQEIEINGARWYVVAARERLGSIEIDVTRYSA